MRKLVSANFSRLFRNKFFWICLALVIGIAVFVAVDFRMSHSWAPEQISHETKEVCFKYTPVLAAIVALFVSLFIGEEYSNKTIRNKIASGYSKGKIYGANWLVCTVVGAVFYLAFFLIIALPIAPWKGLVKYNGYIVAEFIRNAIVSLFAVLAVVSIVVFIAMLVKNRMMGVVAVLVCMLLLFVAAEFMFEGIFMDVQPFGQMLQVKYERVKDIKEILLPLYSLLMMALLSFGGAYLFGKKDLE